MQDYRYDRANSLAAHEAARQEIARKMAAFEAENGPVETLPILSHDKRVPFRITCPERRAADKQKAACSATKGSGSGSNGAAIRAQNVAKVRAIAGSGLGCSAMAKQLGLSRQTVRNIMKELGESPKPVLGTKQAQNRAVLREVWP